jgi:ferredoxin
MVSIPELNVKLLKHTFRFRFFLSRMCRHRAFNKMADKTLFDGDRIYYLPKDGAVKRTRDIQVNIEMKKQDDMILPSDAAVELIKRSRYHFVMNFCICRRSSDCKDFPIDYGCIFLGKGVKNIRGDVGRMVSTEEALDYLDHCRKLGLVQMIGRNKMDSIWLNSGPKEDLLTICNCCPCCCLWKVLPDLPENISRKVAKMDGVDISVDESKCIGCGKCQSICFVKAITIVEGKCRLNADTCRGCGRCAESCPQDAILVDVDKVSVKETADRIAELVDLTGE